MWRLWIAMVLVGCTKEEAKVRADPAPSAVPPAAPRAIVACEAPKKPVRDPSIDLSTALVTPLAKVTVDEVDAPDPQAICKNRWRFKACADKSIAVDPYTHGVAEIRVHIGEQVQVDVKGDRDLPDRLRECITTAARAIPYGAAPAEARFRASFAVWD